MKRLVILMMVIGFLLGRTAVNAAEKDRIRLSYTPGPNTTFYWSNPDTFIQQEVQKAKDKDIVKFTLINGKTLTTEVYRVNLPKGAWVGVTIDKAHTKAVVTQKAQGKGNYRYYLLDLATHKLKYLWDDPAHVMVQWNPAGTAFWWNYELYVLGLGKKYSVPESRWGRNAKWNNEANKLFYFIDATRGQNQRLVVFDIVYGKEQVIKSFSESEYVESLGWSQDFKYAIAREKEQLLAIHLDTGEKRSLSGYIHQMGWNSDGSRFFFRDENQIKALNTANLEITIVRELGQQKNFAYSWNPAQSKLVIRDSEVIYTMVWAG